jgi:hypothetical protein
MGGFHFLITKISTTPTPLQGHQDTISVYLRVKEESDLSRVESILKKKVEGTSLEEKWFTGYLSTATKVRLLNAAKFFVYTFVASAIPAFIATLPTATSPLDAGIKTSYSVGAAVLTALGAFGTIMYKKAEKISDLIEGTIQPADRK